MKPFPRVRELFLRLIAKGKRIALASSAKRDELGIYKRIAHIEDLICEATSSEDANRSKSHPDIFQAALERLRNVKMDEVVAIGDSPYDAQQLASFVSPAQDCAAEIFPRATCGPPASALSITVAPTCWHDTTNRC